MDASAQTDSHEMTIPNDVSLVSAHIVSFKKDGTFFIKFS